MIERILIVGFGSIGRRHLRLARALMPDADIRVLWRTPRSQEPAEANGVFTNLKSATAFKPQLAVIASPSSQHLEYANALINSGCHLMIEKPISNELSGVRELIDSVHASRLICQVGYNLRFSESLIQFRKLILGGVIGQVMTVHCDVGQYLPDWRPEADYRVGASAQKILGGGVLLELSHEIDYLRWIFGEVSWISAWMGKVSNLEVDVEDTALITMECPSLNPNGGVIITLRMDFIRRNAERMCTVYGSEGSLRWNALNNSVEKYSTIHQDWEIIFGCQSDRDETYKSEWKHFLGCIKTGDIPIVSIQDGLAVLEIVEAAKLSSVNQCARQNLKECYCHGEEI